MAQARKRPLGNNLVDLKDVPENNAKRRRTDSCEALESKTGNDEFSMRVAQHYNKLENTGLDVRAESRIYYLRNFNNWIKSTLINLYLCDSGKEKNVLDLCCGKGGDLLKFLRGNVKHLICVDIAGKSVEQCESRYKDILKKSLNAFTSEFIEADCTRVHIREKFQDPNIQLDLVNCQFAFHYCFESLPQAECMLQNASECLKVGGYFIGTMPDANEIVRRARKSDGKMFQNKVFSIKMCMEEPYPLFGAQYDFNLDSVVQCPEFLVHFPTFVKLAAKYGLSLEYRSSFSDFYNKHSLLNERKFLLKKMYGLEPYSLSGKSRQSSDEYEHAENHCKDNNYTGVLGTISKSEWEVISLYQVFAFKKDKLGNDASDNSDNK